jgi:hypothetical protein
MSRRRCCCGKCTIWVDDEFDREDSTDLGPDWEEIVGDWEIQSAHLVPVDLDPTALVLTTSRNPTRRGVLTGYFKLIGDGPWEINFLLNANDEATFYQHVTFSCSETECTLTAGAIGKTYDTDVGLNGAMQPCKPGQWVWTGASGEEFWFRACLVEGLLHLWVIGQKLVPPTFRNFSGCVWDIDTTLSTSGQGHAGIEVVSGDVEFDWLTYVSHDKDVNGEDPDCPDCTCPCEQYVYMPFRIRFDFFAGADCDPCVNGGYLIFEPMQCGTELNYANHWVCVEADLCGKAYTWHANGPGSAARLDCGTSPEGVFVVLIDICSSEIKGTSSIQCSPLSALYEWTAGSFGCDECDPNATFYAYATED